MAECKECGKRLGFFEGADGLCPDCRLISMRNNSLLTVNRQVQELHAKDELDRRETEAAIDAVMLTTEAVTNLNVIRRIEIVSAECAFGMNIFKDLFSSVRDIVGGRSEAVQKTMRDARRTVLHELKREAFLAGANAVIGVDLDYTEIGGTGMNMVMLVASGTAVTIGEEKENKRS